MLAENANKGRGKKSFFNTHLVPSKDAVGTRATIHQHNVNCSCTPKHATASPLEKERRRKKGHEERWDATIPPLLALSVLVA